MSPLSGFLILVVSLTALVIAYLTKQFQEENIIYSNNDQILIVTIMIFALSAILSGYHFGIENSIFDELSACTNGSSDILNKSKLIESLNKTMPVNCKDATFKILGISLAAINTILSILIVIFSIRTLVYEKN